MIIEELNTKVCWLLSHPLQTDHCSQISSCTHHTHRLVPIVLDHPNLLSVLDTLRSLLHCGHSGPGDTPGTALGTTGWLLDWLDHRFGAGQYGEAEYWRCPVFLIHEQRLKERLTLISAAECSAASGGVCSLRFSPRLRNCLLFCSGLSLSTRCLWCLVEQRAALRLSGDLVAQPACPVLLPVIASCLDRVSCSLNMFRCHDITILQHEKREMLSQTFLNWDL